MTCVKLRVIFCYCLLLVHSEQQMLDWSAISPSLNEEFNFSYPLASMSTFTLTSLYTEITFVLTGFSSELKHRW